VAVEAIDAVVTIVPGSPSSSAGSRAAMAAAPGRTAVNVDERSRLRVEGRLNDGSRQRVRLPFT
jgi:hypothetical protein